MSEHQNEPGFVKNKIKAKKAAKTAKKAGPDTRARARDAAVITQVKK